MYITIVGCGRLGSMLAENLANNGYDIAIIDRNAKNLETLGGVGLTDYASKASEFDNDVLIDAGIKQADCLIAATPFDNINITVALVAKKIFSVPRIIAKINDPQKKRVYDSLAIETINPTELSAYILKTRIEEKLK